MLNKRSKKSKKSKKHGEEKVRKTMTKKKQEK